MNSVVAALAVPAAGSALAAAGRLTALARQPFDQWLADAQQTPHSRASATVTDEIGTTSGAARQRIAELQHSVEQRLEELLAGLGIAPGSPLSLRMDATGDRIEVDGPPDIAALVETILNDDPQWAAEFRELARLRRDQPEAARPVDAAMLQHEQPDRTVAADIEFAGEFGSPRLQWRL